MGLGDTSATWKYRLGLREREPAQDLGSNADCGHEVSPVRWIPVSIRPDVEGPAFVTGPAGRPSAALTLVTSGYRIEVGDGFAPETLARLLATLGRL
jgi:hypothetical protein